MWRYTPNKDGLELVINMVMVTVTTKLGNFE